MPHAAGLYYEEHGPRHGLPLILSSGLGGSAGYWAPNVAGLAKWHRVVAYDHRGTGRSDRKVAGDLTVEAMAEDMRALMDALDVERAIPIGHALGGMIGLALAIAHPERVARLVAVNAWGRLDPHTARCFDTRLALLRDSGPRAYLHAQPLFLYPPAWNSAHHDRLLAEEEEQLAHFPGAEMIGRRIAAARRFHPGEAFGTIRARTLFVAADDDMLVPPACSEALKTALPHAQLARMTHGGHACNVTRADDFTMWLLDWLDSEREQG